MSSISLFMNSFLTIGEVALGRLIVNPKDPAHNFCSNAVLDLSAEDISHKPFETIVALTRAESSSSFLASLTRLLNVLAGRSKSSVDRIEAQKAASYKLKNVPQKLEKLVEDNEVKRWLEKVNQRAPVYMVVAFHTLVDSNVELDWKDSSGVSGKATIPVAEALAPGSSSTPAGQALDVAAELEHNHGRETMVSFVAPGERIVAVQYQRVILKAFRRGDVNAPTPDKKTVWESFDASRAAEDVTIVEASLGGLAIEDLPRKWRVGAESAAEGTKFIVFEDQLC